MPEQNYSFLAGLAVGIQACKPAGGKKLGLQIPDEEKVNIRFGKNFAVLKLAGILFLTAAGLRAQATSAWVFFGNDGLLHYQTDSNGNRVMDYSYAGYKGGGVKLPDVSAADPPITPTGGDDTAAIQAAIDAVALRTPDSNGFRGVVLLGPGTFSVLGTVNITTSGVVLRGSGSSGPNTTVINMPVPGANTLTFVNIHGSGSYTTLSSTIVPITDSYVPSGAMSFNVSDASGFHVGDNILITRPVTTSWIHFMNMDTLVRDGLPQTWLAAGSTIRTDRTITAINGNTVTVDVPLTDSFDSTFLNPPGSTVAKYTFAGRISQVGLEHLKITAPPQSVDITLPQDQALTMDAVIDAWIRDVFVQDTENTFTLTLATKQVTFDHVTVAHSIPFTLSAGPVDFAISGTQVLINKCAVTTNPGVWAYATHSRTTGPVVLLNSSSDSRGFSPHQRWATGLLADSCQFPGGTSGTPGIAYSDRGNFGSGHGWDAGWAVAWNVDSPFFLVQAPPGVDNWCIGCVGTKVTAGAPGGPSTLPNGIYDSLGTHVTPPSLYIEQLRERLGDAALVNIGYADFTIGATPNPQTTTAGSSASFTVNLTPQDIYTGNVALSVSGLPAQAAATFTPATVNGGSGSSTLSITNAFPAGTFPLTIQGAVTNLNHSSPVTLIVGKASSITAVSSSGNPSVVGQPVTFTASLSSPTVSSPLETGTVQFKDGAANLGSPVTVSNGSASLMTSSLPVGVHSITAVYSGDGNFFGSTSGGLSQDILKHSTTAILNSSANPSTAGQSVTFTATVSPAGTTGTVDFKEGSTTLGSGTLSGGVASSTISTLLAGPHNITANYQGDGNFLPSVSPALTQAVMSTGAANPTTTQLSTPLTPLHFHQKTTITLTITVAGSGTPTGSVVLLDGNTQLGGSLTLSSGTASYSLLPDAPPFNTTLLRPGVHNIRAVYLGDGSFDGSPSSIQVVNSSPRFKPH